jgi:hypothetical protein
LNHSHTIHAQVMLSRKMIMSCLYTREVELLAAVHTEVQLVSEAFNKGQDQQPPYLNMPRHSSRVLWCRCLADRIRAPMEDARRLLRNMSGSEEWQQLSQKYDTLMHRLDEFQREEVARWHNGLDGGKIAEKLKQPLLVRDVSTKLLRLNFDPAVWKVLRESKYFHMMDVQVRQLGGDKYFGCHVRLGNVMYITFVYVCILCVRVYTHIHT